MEENINSAKGQSEPDKAENETATTPQENVPTVSVKFNKKERKLSLNEAGELAQKGLKFDMISGDYNRLKEIASKSGRGVPEFLDLIESKAKQDRMSELMRQTGGNGELCSHILELEGETAVDNGFSELHSAFPEIEQIGDLPEEAVESASLKGTRLLDEYLRWLLKQQKEKQKADLKKSESNDASVGSQKSEGMHSASSEFVKGIWNR